MIGRQIKKRDQEKNIAEVTDEACMMEKKKIGEAGVEKCNKICAPKNIDGAFFFGTSTVLFYKRIF